MSYETIKYGVNKQVATIALSRPDRLNAMTPTMWEELHQAFALATDDSDVRAIVLTGEGKGFCAGADISRLHSMTKNESSPIGGGAAESVAINRGLALPRGFSGTYSYIATVPKPVIAAINGAAAGIGLVMALFCDIRFASESSVFITAFSRRGLIAEHGLAWALPRIVGLGRAFDLLYSARRVGAEEAVEIGLVDRLCADKSLLTQTQDYAAKLAANASPRSLRVMKRQVLMGLAQDIDSAMALAKAEMAASMESEDFKEGIASYLEKRQARFPPL